MISRAFKGIWIPAELWLMPDIPITQKVLLAEIESLDDGEGCFATNEYLANFMGISVGRLKNILVELSDKNLVETVAFDGRRRRIKQTAYRVTSEVTKTLPLPNEVTKTLPETSRFRDPSSIKEDSKANNSNAEGEALPLRPKPRNELFDALCEIEGTNVNEIGKSGGRIAAALRNIKAATPNVTAEDIKLRAKNYRAAWPKATLTANALATHWAKFGTTNHVNTASRTANTRDFENGARAIGSSYDDLIARQQREWEEANPELANGTRPV